MNMLNPQQKQAVNQFKGQPNQTQAETIAKLCNAKGINKNELATIINSLQGRS